MGSADRYADGEWNFYCDYCGRKAKSSTAVKTWDNFYVCRHHKPVRNPQDFIKGVRDQQNVPWARPEPGESVAPPALCTALGISSTIDDAVVDCTIVS